MGLLLIAKDTSEHRDYIHQNTK
ncbi:hypothetical protein [Psychrobacter sp. HD31]